MPFDRVSFVNGGYCVQFGYFAGSASRGRTHFQNVFVVLEHPRHGVSMIDTGYAPAFLEATKPFPQRLYRWTLPVHLGPQAARFEPHSIFISHFHGDHVAGLRDFPNARFVYRREAHESLMSRGTLRQVCHGFLPALLPDDFTARGNALVEDAFTPGSGEFAGLRVHDYWGDGELLLVDLPGHSPGHTGFAFCTANEQFFYIADACWDRDSMLSGHRLPLSARWLQESAESYEETQAKLRRFAALNGWTMLACHCPRTQEYAR